MRRFGIACVVATFWLGGCNTNSTSTSTSTSPAALSTVRNYNGTASVGDFLTISIDSNAKTITYQNRTNGDSGTVPYTVNADGTYTVTDPNGNLLAAYEVPGSAMLVESAKSGPSQSTPALITAVEQAPASIGTFAGRNFNYVQFRTSGGGVELGTVTVGAQGDIQHDAYWPKGEIEQPQAMFSGGTFPASSVVEDASGNSFTIHESNGSDDSVFGTQSGFFVVDTQNGTILGLPKASAKAFDATNAGTYTAILYEKSNAQTGQNNVESGTPVEDKGTVTITAGGGVTIKDSQLNTLATGTLVAIADAPYIYDGTANTLSDPCFGMFTARMTTANSQQDVFVSFQGGSVIFASFETGLPFQTQASYSNFYGVGLK